MLKIQLQLTVRLNKITIQLISVYHNYIYVISVIRKAELEEQNEISKTYPCEYGSLWCPTGFCVWTDNIYVLML